MNKIIDKLAKELIAKLAENDNVLYGEYSHGIIWSYLKKAYESALSRK